MSAMKVCAPALLLLAVCAPANAQVSFENTYHVEIRLEHWRIGYSFWSSEFTTTSYQEATLMEDLFDLALDAGVIHSMLDIDDEFLVTDVRIRTVYPEQLIRPVGQPQIGRRVDYSVLVPSYGKR